MSVQDRYKKLVSVLDHEIKIYRHLLERVRQEKQILVSPNIEELNENNEAKELMVNKLKLLEKERERVARELASELDMESESPRLLELALKIDQDKGDRLRAIHTTLDLLVSRIKEFNKENEALVKSALESINGAMSAIKETMGSKKSTYEDKGKMKSGKVDSGKFVSKSI